MLACGCTARARGPAAVKLKPGGVISPFCEPAIATSTPQASISNGMQPSDATASTISSASWPAARFASPIALMSFCTPDAVSTCATKIALIDLSAFNLASTASGRTARRKSPGSTSTCAPSIFAASPQPIAKRPLSSTSTLSPRESTLVSAASQAPWPFAA